MNLSILGSSILVLAGVSFQIPTANAAVFSNLGVAAIAKTDAGIANVPAPLDGDLTICREAGYTWTK